MTQENKIQTLRKTRDSLAHSRFEKFQFEEFQKLRSVWNQLQEISDSRIKKDIASEHYNFTNDERKKA